MNDTDFIDRRILQLCAGLEGPTLEMLLIPFADSEKPLVKGRIAALVTEGKLAQVGYRYRRVG